MKNDFTIMWRNGVINNSSKWRWWCRQALGILGDANMSRHKWWFATSFFVNFLQFVNDAAPWCVLCVVCIIENCEIVFTWFFSAKQSHTAVISAKFGLSTQNAKIRFFKSKYVEILQTKKCKKFVIKPVQSFYYTFLTWCYVLKMYLKWKKHSIKDSNNICICTIYLNIVQKVLKHFLL